MDQGEKKAEEGIGRGREKGKRTRGGARAFDPGGNLLTHNWLEDIRG